jgi:hypothetical protein
MSKIDYIFRAYMVICRGDREKAKKCTRAYLKHLLNFESLWIPRRVEHGQRLKAEEE